MKTRHASLDGRVFEFSKYEPTYHDFGSVTFTELHESTLPEAIIAQHREEVSDAYHVRGLDTAEEIAEALYLPLWNVRRALESLGVKLEPAPANVSPTKAIRGRIFPCVLAAMRASRSVMTAAEIARATGMVRESVSHALRKHPDYFMVVRISVKHGKRISHWKLVETPT